MQGIPAQSTYLAWALHIIVSPKDRVGSCQYTRSRIEDGRDTSLSDGDGLLFHRFVDSHSVLVSHLVKLVDTDDSAICQNHCAAFEVEFTLQVSIITRFHRSIVTGRGRRAFWVELNAAVVK
jgi:hypothetical protein